jgi:hypothetical protein
LEGLNNTNILGLNVNNTNHPYSRNNLAWNRFQRSEPSLNPNLTFPTSNERSTNPDTNNTNRLRRVIYDYETDSNSQGQPRAHYSVRSRTDHKLEDEMGWYSE